jgi:hypothetical protein
MYNLPTITELKTNLPSKLNWKYIDVRKQLNYSGLKIYKRHQLHIVGILGLHVHLRSDVYLFVLNMCPLTFYTLLYLSLYLLHSMVNIRALTDRQLIMNVNSPQNFFCRASATLEMYNLPTITELKTNWNRFISLSNL